MSPKAHSPPHADPDSDAAKAAEKVNK